MLVLFLFLGVRLSTATSFAGVIPTKDVKPPGVTTMIVTSTQVQFQVPIQTMEYQVQGIVYPPGYIQSECSTQYGEYINVNESKPVLISNQHRWGYYARDWVTLTFTLFNSTMSNSKALHAVKVQTNAWGGLGYKYSS